MNVMFAIPDCSQELLSSQIIAIRGDIPKGYTALDVDQFVIKLKSTVDEIGERLKANL